MNLGILVAATVLASLAASSRHRPRTRGAAAATLLAVLALAPVVSGTTSILFDALTAMCIAYGWNVIGGYTGYAAFGNVAYLGAGAFVAAGFMSRQPGHLTLPWFVGIPLAVVIVSLAAGAVGLAVLRLRGHYFSIATLGVAIATPQIIQWDFFFGPRGLIPNFFGGGRPLNFPLVPDLELFGSEFGADRYLLYYLGLLTALIGFGVTAALMQSKVGYALVAIRENEEAAEVMGIDTTRMKSLAYMLSAALAALGGAVIGYRLTNLTTEAEALFSTANNLQMIVITLIGGSGRLWGPAIGAFILFGIQEAIRSFSSSNAFVEWQAVVFAILIIIVVLFLPRGLMYFLDGRGRLSWRVLLRDLVAHRV
jgi:branched-chain amino acid transport system permease protein